MDVVVPIERNLLTNRVKNFDYSNDSIDDRGSDDTRITEGNYDFCSDHIILTSYNIRPSLIY